MRSEAFRPKSLSILTRKRSKPDAFNRASLERFGWVLANLGRALGGALFNTLQNKNFGQSGEPVVGNHLLRLPTGLK